MAFVESAVVVDLRAYLEHAQLALVPLPPKLLHVEIAREVATIVMLFAVARLESRRPRVLLAFFIYCMGVWDIFYYVWLKVLIGWPPDLLTTDVLFLIPVPWLGPVLSPCIVSLLFIVGGLLIVRFEGSGAPLRFDLIDWVSSFVGACIVFASYLVMAAESSPADPSGGYPWWLFSIGVAIWLAVLGRRVVAARAQGARGSR